MIKLSVNINKFATIRNARGGDNPNIVNVALDCERFGADGITVHPRPDERHIRYADVYELKEVLTTELNIEGNPKEQKFVDLVLATKPTQVTLVPDGNTQLTSDHGWDTIAEASFLKQTIARFKDAGIRTSIFVDPITQIVEAAQATGTDRIELYTEAYAHKYLTNAALAVEPYIQAAHSAKQFEIGINAGHDLSLLNLRYFAMHIPHLLEVSIGHALICDALYLGIENTIAQYKKQLQNSTLIC
jgi:pyridoxine 5-phosphate synthase